MKRVPIFYSRSLPGPDMGHILRVILQSNGDCVSVYKVHWPEPREECRSVAQNDVLTSRTVVSPLLLLIGSPWLPESPRWLIINRRQQEGFANLRKLHSRRGDPEEILAREEFLQIRRQVELESTETHGIRQLLKRPSSRKRLLCGFLVE